MSPKYRCILQNAIFSLLIQCVIGQKDSKSSLTFVIDDTASMTDDIDQVKKGADAIFDTVMNHNESQIENFILVTFNDPDTELLAITKDRNEFKRELSSIKVHGGGLCPEYSMTGIKRALEASLPRSSLYVFTDASSEDYKIYESVKNLALSKQCQVVFVLTDDCGDEGSYDVYPNLAAATGGAVFNLERQEIGIILDYVKHSIRKRLLTLDTFSLPPGNNNVTINIDSTIKDVTVAVSSRKHIKKVDMMGPDGKKLDTNMISKLDKITIVNSKPKMPGLHTITVDSVSSSSVLVTADSDILIQHGFSTITPKSIAETTPTPIPDVQSYLAVQLTKGRYPLVAVKIRDMKKNYVSFVANGIEVFETPLIIFDTKTQFYVTEPILPPNTTYQIAIIGYDPKTKTNITKFTPFIEQQKKIEEHLKYTIPSVEIEGDSSVHVTYDDPLRLICKVKAYPQPEIVWTKRDNSTILPSKTSVYRIPDEFISIFVLDNVRENTTYQCKANNINGNDLKNVEVNTGEPPVHFNILDRHQKVTKIEYQKTGKLHCKVDAYPLAQIIWYKKDKMVVPSDTIELSDDNSTLTIKRAEPTNAGKYVCEARNSNTRQLVFKFMTLTEFDAPKIAQTSDQSVKKGSSVNIECKLLQGKPKPTIEWYYAKSEYSMNIKRKEWTDMETLTLNDVTKAQSGFYLCVASNAAGIAKMDTKLVVEYGPSIEKGEDQIKVKGGNFLTIKCNVDGVPTPRVTWFKDGSPLTGYTSYYRNQTIEKEVYLPDSGYYTCEATNKYSTAVRHVKVEVVEPARIVPPEKSVIIKKVGEILSLPCNAYGYPKPIIQWLYRKFDSEDMPTIISTEALHINLIQVRHEGSYTCLASNTEGLDYITYDVHVFVPPTIENHYKSRLLIAVDGDVALRVTCNAFGNPRPNIVWSKDDDELDIGPMYSTEGNTLIIKDVRSTSEGVYNCEAYNDHGSAQDTFTVIVLDSPKRETGPPIIFVEEGKPADILCNINHIDYPILDQVRWYKDGKRLPVVGRLRVPLVTASTGGHYSCRASGGRRALNGAVTVVVGHAPRFTVPSHTAHVPLTAGPPALLDCNYAAIPKPTVTWYHDGIRLASRESTYELEMFDTNAGKYTCEVENDFGKIVRTFDAVTSKCFINTGNLPKQPLLLSSNLKWLDTNTFNKQLVVDSETALVLYCPSRFQKFPTSHIEAFCQTSKIIVDGVPYQYSDLQCNEEVNYTVIKTGEKCLSGNTERIKIVYENVSSEITGDSLELYEICMDKKFNVPIYTKHNMQQSPAFEDIDSPWLDKDKFLMNFDDAYNCNRQVNAISASLGRYFHDPECCFSRRQLINPKDVSMGVPQRATYSYYNVVPHWSTCNMKNWEDLEQIVRTYAKSSLYSGLTVWTGTSGQLRLPNGYSKAKVYIKDMIGDSQPVPLYLWKVVQDPWMESSIAVVQLNIPNLSPSESSKYVPCKDNICKDIKWLNGTQWRDVTRGYTFCCSIGEFEANFGFKGLFHRKMENVLEFDSDKYDIPMAGFSFT